MSGLDTMAIVATVFATLFFGVGTGWLIVARNRETPENRRNSYTINALILFGIGAVWLAVALLMVIMGLPAMVESAQFWPRDGS